jgi:uncharacterized iron-regulated protein
MRGWVDSQSFGAASPVAASTTCKCFAARTNAKTDANALLDIYAAAAAFEFAAPTAASTELYLSISEVAFTPNTMGSQTRFMFKPVNSWHASYADATVWTYQFGSSVSFGSDAVC